MIARVHQIVFSDARGGQLKGYLRKATRTTRKMFRGHDYQLWDLCAAESFIDRHFPPGVLAAFQSLVPYAYKADLFKYCLLYQLGGWYLDAGVMVLKDPVCLLEHDPALDFLVFRATGVWDAPWACSVAFLYAKPGHAVFKATIDQVLANCRRRDYGNNPLHVTMAPFGQALAVHGEHAQIAAGTVVDVDGKPYRRAYELKPHGLLAARKPKGNVAGDLNGLGLKNGNNYVQLWRDRLVFSQRNEDHA